MTWTPAKSPSAGSSASRIPTRRSYSAKKNGSRELHVRSSLASRPFPSVPSGSGPTGPIARTHGGPRQLPLAASSPRNDKASRSRTREPGISERNTSVCRVASAACVLRRADARVDRPSRACPSAVATRGPDVRLLAARLGLGRSARKAKTGFRFRGLGVEGYGNAYSQPILNSKVRHKCFPFCDLSSDIAQRRGTAP